MLLKVAFPALMTPDFIYLMAGQALFSVDASLLLRFLFHRVWVLLTSLELRILCNRKVV